MKWFGIILMAALLAATPGLGMAQQSKGPAPKGSQAPPAAKSYTPKEWEEYRNKTAAALEALQQRIGEFKGKTSKAQPQMKRAMLRISGTLTQKEIAARDKLAVLEKASEKDWSRLKAEMDQIMEDLTKATEAAESQIK